MPTAARHLLSILLLPFLVVVVIPVFLLTAFSANDSRWVDSSSIASAARAIGAVIVLLGFSLSAWCVLLFARVGQGTLAPWDPTRSLVAVGPYRHVRNPMISGVALMLFGGALFFGSLLLTLWAFVFLIVNHIYFVLLEEPGLEARFGENYLNYKTNVPRWLPRRTPWLGE